MLCFVIIQRYPVYMKQLNILLFIKIFHPNKKRERQRRPRFLLCSGEVSAGVCSLSRYGKAGRPKRAAPQREYFRWSDASFAGWTKREDRMHHAAATGGGQIGKKTGRKSHCATVGQGDEAQGAACEQCEHGTPKLGPSAGCAGEKASAQRSGAQGQQRRPKIRQNRIGSVAAEQHCQPSGGAAGDFCQRQGGMCWRG